MGVVSFVIMLIKKIISVLVPWAKKTGIQLMEKANELKEQQAKRQKERETKAFLDKERVSSQEQQKSVEAKKKEESACIPEDLFPEQQPQSVQKEEIKEEAKKDIKKEKRMAPPLSSFKTTEIIKHGLGLFFRKFFLIVWLYFLMGILGVILFGCSDAIQQYSENLEIVCLFVFFGGFLSLLTGFFKILVKIGLGEKGRIRYLFSGFLKLIDLVVGLLFYILLVVFGLILFIIPGVNFALRGQFFFLCILHENKSPLAALRQSFKVTKGLVSKLLELSFMLLLFNVLGALPMFFGLIITVPVTIISLASIYDRLTRQKIEKDTDKIGAQAIA